jgi:hypothetical protein
LAFWKMLFLKGFGVCQWRIWWSGVRAIDLWSRICKQNATINRTLWQVLSWHWASASNYVDKHHMNIFNDATTNQSRAARPVLWSRQYIKTSHWYCITCLL